MHIDANVTKFIANCFIHKAAKLSRDKFLEKLNHVKYIRTTHLKAFSLIPRTEEDWVAIERFYYIVTKGDFGQEASFPYNRPESKIFGIYVPIDIFNWFNNNSLSTIQKQITLYIASVSFENNEDIHKDIFPLLLTEIERIIAKYYSSKDIWNGNDMDEAYSKAALDYFNSQIPQTLSLNNGSDEENIVVCTSYFTLYDWNHFVLKKVVTFEDTLKRTESTKDAWSMWSTTFRRYPMTRSHIFSLFDDEYYGYIYIIRAGSTNEYKIGWTSNSNIELRKSSLQTGSSEFLEIIDSFPVASKKAEKTIHGVFSDNRGSGEWFNLTDKDIDDLRSAVWRRENNIF